MEMGMAAGVLYFIILHFPHHMFIDKQTKFVHVYVYVVCH